MGRFPALALLALALCGCGVASHTVGSVQETYRFVFESPKVRAAKIASYDDAKCRELGFKPDTEGYGNCRLKLAQVRATNSAAASSNRPATQAAASGRKVYSASECIGPVIMGECKGSILPNKAYHPTCHGQMLNGRCTGPMF